MFNEYTWETYLKAGGKNVVDFFKRNLCDSFSDKYADEICKFHKAYCPSDTISKSITDCLNELNCSINTEDYGFFYPCYPVAQLQENGATTETIMDVFYNGLMDNDGMTNNDAFSEFSAGMPYYTTFLAVNFPELFVPYYFQCNFNVFNKIAQQFGIGLPTIPSKKEYKMRIYYYGKICDALSEFRKQHSMSMYELCAFLYDFAPKYIGGTASYIINDLPSPKSAYFIGASKNDPFLRNISNIVTPWQCNPETKAGDMIVMYLKTPISAIDSVWRSVSIGFDDPFFYYYRCAYISTPNRIKQISLKQLHQDEIFRDLPIVRKNMQGINGVELYPSVYNHLLDIAQCKIPRIDYISSNFSGDFHIEKDVENKLIKPFLYKLGFSKEEYRQELYIEIGNHNHALIPDFVIHPLVEQGHQSADFIIEAKLSIMSKKFLEEAKTQARGYAKLLSAKYSVIASKEGIWISRAADDYSNDILAFSWAELNNEDNFFMVFKLIGNGKL